MSNPWILGRTQTGSRRLKLLCLPHAGGGSAAYLSWNDALGTGCEVLPLQLPGRETRLVDAPIAEMTQLIDELALALLPVTASPYAIYGHSMGAHVAYELARRFRVMGRPAPVCLVVSGARAPHLPLASPPLADLPEPALVQALGHRYGNNFDADMMDLLRLMLPTLRADLRLIEQHVHEVQAPLNLPIHAMAGTEDDSVPLADARQWGLHTDMCFEFKSFAGGHFFTTSARTEFLPYLAKVLRQHCDAAIA